MLVLKTDKTGAPVVEIASARQAAVRQGNAAGGNELPIAVMGNGGREAPRQPEKAAPAEVRQAVSDLNSYVQVLERDIVFTVDAGSGRSIIRVVDAETGELIRQIPPEEVVAVSRALANTFQEITGLLLNDKG